MTFFIPLVITCRNFFIFHNFSVSDLPLFFQFVLSGEVQLPDDLGLDLLGAASRSLARTLAANLTVPQNRHGNAPFPKVRSFVTHAPLEVCADSKPVKNNPYALLKLRGPVVFRRALQRLGQSWMRSISREETRALFYQLECEGFGRLVDDGMQQYFAKALPESFHASLGTDSDPESYLMGRISVRAYEEAFYASDSYFNSLVPGTKRRIVSLLRPAMGQAYIDVLLSMIGPPELPPQNSACDGK